MPCVLVLFPVLAFLWQVEPRLLLMKVPLPFAVQAHFCLLALFSWTSIFFGLTYVRDTLVFRVAAFAV